MPISVPQTPPPAPPSRRDPPPHRPGRGRHAPSRWYGFTPPERYSFRPPLTAIRIILHDSDPTYSHVHIPDNLDQYSHRIGNLAAMLASVLARPLQHPEQHHVAIAIIGRIIRTASICSNIHLPTISTNTAIAILVTHALEDIAILAPTLPTELVAPLHRDILIATNAGRISAVHTLTPNPQSET